jgi:choline dehydrogenase-like flavoprotein
MFIYRLSATGGSPASCCSWVICYRLAIIMSRCCPIATTARGRHTFRTNTEPNGLREVFRGDIVVVSCGAANSAKLLLMSANDKHPNGLANGPMTGARRPRAPRAGPTSRSPSAGTCRFGTDAKTSVLDRNCKAHEVDNLYVVDTSFFVSIGAVNPSPTRSASAITSCRGWDEDAVVMMGANRIIRRPNLI